MHILEIIIQIFGIFKILLEIRNLLVSIHGNRSKWNSFFNKFRKS